MAPIGIGVQTAQRNDARTGLLHPVSERRQRRISRGPSTERRATAVLDDWTCPPGYSVKAWPPTHQIVGVEQIAQERDGLAEHPGPVGQQLDRLLVALPGRAQHRRQGRGQAFGRDDPQPCAPR